MPADYKHASKALNLFNKWITDARTILSQTIRTYPEKFDGFSFINPHPNSTSDPNWETDIIRLLPNKRFAVEIICPILGKHGIKKIDYRDAIIESLGPLHENEVRYYDRYGGQLANYNPHTKSGYDAGEVSEKILHAKSNGIPTYLCGNILIGCSLSWGVRNRLIRKLEEIIGFNLKEEVKKLEEKR